MKAGRILNDSQDLEGFQEENLAIYQTASKSKCKVV